MPSMQSFVWLACVVTLCCSASVRNRRQAEPLRPFSLEEIFPSQFGMSGFNGVWISDTEFRYTIAGSPGIYIYDMTSLSSTLFVSGDVLSLLNSSSITISPDRQYILAASDIVSVFRYSTTARYALYNIANGNINYVADNQRLELCTFAGVGHGLAYVLENNVFYQPEDLQQPVVQLTFDGIPGVVYNGHADWVYEEEILGTGSALWFSTDGNRLAIASFDDTQVETYSYYFFSDTVDPEDPYPDLYPLKYPKVGRRNPTVTLRHINLQEAVTGSINWIPLEAPAIVTSDHVLGAVTWVTSNEVATHWLNRRQNLVVLRICDVVNGGCSDDVYEEPEGWVKAALPTFSSSGNFYTYLRWTEPQEDNDQWTGLQVTYRQPDGSLSREYVAAGRFTVMSLIGMTEQDVGTTFYYLRTVTDEPWRRHVYANNTCLSCSIQMPQGGECNWVTATVSSNGAYLSITCQSTYEPAFSVLVEGATGNILTTWEDNQDLRDRLAEYQIPERLTTTVPLGNGKEAPVTFYLPPGIDLYDDSVSYPVIFYVYSGPAYYLVQDILSLGYSAYLPTNRSIIYMMADGRGSDLKGKEMLYSINNGMGSVEIEDHLVILRAVIERYPWIDASRIGMWGSSYGGYSTLLTLINDDENLVRCGVSSAPVTSWLYYDTLYTERYMGLPTEEDNLAGYLNGDIAAQAEKLRGKDFYIMHGNADDNVHYQNAAALMKKLQELNIPFEQMSYPDEAHSLAGVPRHRYNTMDRYWTECLDLQDRIY